MNFSLNDGTIVLFSNKYNLGRLETVTDLYFNDNEDVYTTIEADKPLATPAPTPVPRPTPPPQNRDDVKRVNATITWIPPEEAVNMALPDAVTLPPKVSSSSSSSPPKTNGGSGSQQVLGSSSNQASQAQ